MEVDTESDIQGGEVLLTQNFLQHYLDAYKKFLLVLPVLFLAALWLARSSPFNFPVNVPIRIDRGLSAGAITYELDKNNVVRSSTALYLVLVALQKAGEVKAGTYVFTEPLSVFGVANSITENPPPDTLTTLTLPEGFTVKEFATIAEGVLTDFDRAEFVRLTGPYEGFLFPDTYHVPVDYTPKELADLLAETYKKKTTHLEDEWQKSDMSQEEVVTLASVVEREANTEESMAIVTSILLRRLEIGMALQVDASMEYVLGKPLNELTAEDLQIDTPYNTYLYPGLPPTPIGNPGLQSIEAVLYPLDTEYLYYLTDENGEFHYARTFDEHKQNIAKYLK